MMRPKSPIEQQCMEATMNASSLLSSPLPAYEVDRSDSFSFDDGTICPSPLREAFIEFRERQILEQYYETSRVLKTHIRGGSYIVKAASMSPIKPMIKVKTL